jgi:CHASE2 domain-containing sensor protein
MQPLLVLVVMPLAVGFLAAVALRDTRRASLAAAVVSTAILYACLSALNPSGEWTVLATFMVSPLVLAITLFAVLVTFGHGHLQRRARHS